jgi:hypothetical protein
VTFKKLFQSNSFIHFCTTHYFNTLTNSVSIVYCSRKPYIYKNLKKHCTCKVLSKLSSHVKLTTI